MTVKFVQVGNVIDFTTAGAVAVGDLLLMSHIVGVAMKAAAGSGEVIPVMIEGIVEGVPKVSAAVFVVGEKLLLDVSATPDAFDDSAATPATGDVMGAAVAAKAGGNGETTCTIKLTPGNSTIT